MKISYCICSHNEIESLFKLLEKLVLYKLEDDEIIILDDFSDNDETKKILNKFNGLGCKVIQHALNKNYGEHKNEFNTLAKNDWIFQLDGDELPSDYTIGENLHNIINSNPETELIFVPRINDYIGTTAEHAAMWGWRLSPSPFCEGRSIINFPDFQGRIHRRVPGRIKWEGRLHERIVGHTSYVALPAEEDFALYHNKTIEKQLDTNKRYNIWFTPQENKGHNVFSKK